MYFEDSYFKNEVRDGFLIPGMVKRSWAMQIEILEKVSDICKRHELKWFADYGTLIGAVRHKGFVPWDDDLDICMLREDYDKFHKIAKKELPEEFIIHCVEDTEDYDNFLMRITKGQTVTLNIEHLRQNHGFPYCAGIDIFPLDYLYENEEKENERLEKVKKMIEISEMKSDEIARMGEKNLIMRIEAYSGYSVDRSIPLYEALVRIVDKLYKEAPREGAKRVAVMYFYTKFNFQIRPLEYYEKSIEVPFETSSINVPARFDEVLTLEYGSWGVANRRGGLHEYPFFSLHERKLQENGGTVPYRFEMDKLSLDEEQERIKHHLSCDKNANILSTLQKVHRMIENLIWQGEWEYATQLCGKCQELAILVGNNIEDTYELSVLKRRSELVNCLEKYCEGIFQLYETLSVREQSEAIEKNRLMANCIPNLLHLFKLNHREKKLVLFLPIKDADWVFIKPFYEEQLSRGKKDGNLEVLVMPLPYHDRGDDGSISNSHWDFDSFSEELPLVDYHQMKLEQYHFEKIYFVDPYDAYQSGMTVDPDYYSHKLYQICDELILIDTLEISDPLDEKTTENLKHYVLTPGVMRADQVIVPDEDTKTAFEKILAGNKNGSIEKNIQVERCLLNINERRSIPGRKKKLLFFTSIADFYGHKEKLFAWLDSRLEALESSKECLQVFWVEPISLQQDFFKDYPDNAASYNHFIARFKAKCDGVVISEAEAETRIDEFDAFYGSAGYLMNQCARRKLPAMIRNMEV